MSTNVQLGNATVNVPEEYDPIEPMPFDPPESAAWRKETSGAICYFQIKTIPAEEALPLDARAVIDDVHEHLDDDQGLIEAEGGKTAAGLPFVYRIVRTNLQPGNILYALRLDVHAPDAIWSVRASFNTLGSSSYRDSLVLSKIEGTYDGWFFDPYDPDFAYGNLMNRSELPEYDKDFPDHPLTRLRRLVSNLLENN